MQVQRDGKILTLVVRFGVHARYALAVKEQFAAYEARFRALEDQLGKGASWHGKGSKSCKGPHSGLALAAGFAGRTGTGSFHLCTDGRTITRRCWLAPCKMVSSRFVK